MKKIDVLTLGCSKNLVDSENLMGRLQALGYEVTHDVECPDGEICIINTCGFIGDAKEESINMILEQGQRKAQGTLQSLYVMGCLSQRYQKELEAEIPEVDGWFGKFDWKGIVERLEVRGERLEMKGESSQRCLTTPSHYAYIKISEGCDRRCAYCAIPIITGKHISRPKEEILDEVRMLVSRGVKEFQIIAQELTYYGVDLYHRRAIAELIDEMAQIEGVRWIRLHYAYPTDFPWDLVEVMKRRANVCKYLDVALQHISDSVLKSMHRHITKAETYDFIDRLRRELPGIHIRTTLMVGFPGETEEDFKELMDFVRWARFERMGAFAYSEEEGTYSGDHYTDDVPDDVKQQRLSQLMRLQQRISEEKQQDKVGQKLSVIFDRVEGDYLVGRTEFDSPDVDPEVLVKIDYHNQTDHFIGEIFQVKITSAEEFDLYGTIVE